MYRKIFLVLIVLLTSSCSLAPKKLTSFIQLTGKVTNGTTNLGVAGAEILVTRCFLPRSIVPICEFLPLAKYESNSEGKFVSLFYLKGLYRIYINACIDGQNYHIQEDLEIKTGYEQLPSLNLSKARYGKCVDDI